MEENGIEILPMVWQADLPYIENKQATLHLILRVPAAATANLVQIPLRRVLTMRRPGRKPASAFLSMATIQFRPDHIVAHDEKSDAALPPGRASLYASERNFEPKLAVPPAGTRSIKCKCLSYSLYTKICLPDHRRISMPFFPSAAGKSVFALWVLPY